MIKVIDDIVDIFDQEIIKHQVMNESWFQYTDDVSIKNNQHQRRPGFKHIFEGQRGAREIQENEQSSNPGPKSGKEWFKTGQNGI